MKTILLLLSTLFLSGMKGNEISQIDLTKTKSNKFCGPRAEVHNNDNASDIYLVKLTHVLTGTVYWIYYGQTTLEYMNIGIYNVEVWTDDGAGQVKCSPPLSSEQCQDAYSWDGDSKVYYFYGLDLTCCACPLIISIDEVEC